MSDEPTKCPECSHPVNMHGDTGCHHGEEEDERCPCDDYPVLIYERALRSARQAVEALRGERDALALKLSDQESTNA